MQDEAIPQGERAALVETHTAEGGSVWAQPRLAENDGACRAGLRGPGGEPNGGNPTCRGIFVVAYLSGKNDVIEFVDALIVGKGRSGCGADTGDRAWPASSIGKVDSRTRKRSGLFENHTVARRRVIVVPLQHWAKTRGRTQHPFPIIRLDGTTDRRTPQLLD